LLFLGGYNAVAEPKRAEIELLRRIQTLLQRPAHQGALLLEAAILLAAYAAATWWLPGENPARPVAESVAVLVAAVVAVLRISQVLPHLPAGTRRAWMLVGLGQLAALGACFFLEYLGALLPALGFIGTAAGILRLLAFVLAAGGLFLYPYSPRHDPTRFRFILDALIACGAVVALIFLVLVRPLALRDPSLDWLLPVAFASADAILIVILANFTLAHSIPRSLGVFLGAAWAAMLASDYARASLVLMGGYAPGSLLSIGWVMAPLLIASGAVHERDRALRQGTNAHPKPVPDMGTQFQRVMPIALELVLVWYVLMDWRMRGELSAPAFWMSTVLGAVLVARLGIRAGEAQLEQYWRLFKNLPDPSFIVDSRGEVRLGNPAWDDLGEVAAANDHLKPVVEVFDGVSPAALAEAAQAGKSLEVTHRASGRPFLITVSPFSGESRRTLFAAVAHDMTEQKRQNDVVRHAYDELRRVHVRLEQMNAELEERVDERTHSLQAAYRTLEDQNRALQRLDQMKTDFVNLVSHELRAPLTNVSGGVELMLKRNHDAGESGVLRLIQTEIRRLTRFVENILSVAAIEAGRYVLHPMPMDVQEVVGESASVWDSLPERGRIEVRVAEGLPLVLADEAAVRSTLVHLIDNALKYAPESPVRIDAELCGEVVKLQVSDRGPGVPLAKQHLLFQPFERLNASDSQQVYGHGLGLYLSQRLLDAMGSELRFESPPGGGVRFFFCLEPAR
jgi:signal transduction histidine kinase